MNASYDLSVSFRGWKLRRFRRWGGPVNEDIGCLLLANHRPALDAAMSISLDIGRHWRRASEAERWA